ncbi:glycosyltransferase family 2 protein [Tessaracoccus sp. OS52]|uniref:glycosyltransferase family 2 protein n=1 Tax=Tessaracoccus sp. OS52 TaxID=2886691 RepID=UPI001D119498|nr:glycosyltransferase family 2 protein [Tessaracoccus sp. OS52]MCC2592351.1 glycosyltransferase family 2 protein [Tessaracoccus sp. OS52]
MVDQPGVSVVMPIRNEERHLARAVERVLHQDYAGDLEVVLSVGPSQDRTWEVATRLAASEPHVRVVENPTGLTPAGLNIAIAAASHDILVRVDGHGELSEGYIARAVKLLEETGAANVGGRMDARGETPFEEAVAAAYNSRLGLGGGGFHLADTPAGPAPTVFLGAFRRAPLAEIGGFDETMHRAQDWELNYRLRQAGHVVWFSPDLTVLYRPRSSLRALARQFWTTGQWRREVARRHPETLNLRYLAPPVAVAGLAVGLVGGLLGLVVRNRWLGALLLAPAVYLVFLVVATAAMKDVSPAGRLRLPVVLATMHVCWGAGFLRGPGR